MLGEKEGGMFGRGRKGGVMFERNQAYTQEALRQEGSMLVSEEPHSMGGIGSPGEPQDRHSLTKARAVEGVKRIEK